MIDEIRKIKLQPILEQLQGEGEDEIRAKIKNNEEEIAREYKKDLMSSKANKLEKENRKLKDKLDELEELKREKSRIESASLSDLGMDFEEAVKFLQEHNIDIVLTEEDKTAIYNPENQNKNIESLKDLILVHKTDYPPKDSKIKSSKESRAKRSNIIEIKGKEYKFEYEDPRNTIHFYDNGEVGTNDGGGWDNCKYIVLIPFDSVNTENIVGGSMVDTYFKGIVDLPDNAVILCPIGEKSKIQRDNPDITIFEYEGEKALGYGNAIVSALGYYEDGLNRNYWGDREKEKQAKELYQKLGFKECRHKGSKEGIEETKKAVINGEVKACKTVIEKLQEIEGKSDLYKVKFPPYPISEDQLDTLFEELEKNGIKIPEIKKKIVSKSFKENPIKVLEECEGNEELFDEMKKDIQEYNLIKDSQKDDRGREMLNYILLSEIGKERLLEIQKEKEELLRQKVLSKKMKDFTYDFYNATDEELKTQQKLHEECMKQINQRLKSKGINKYYFSTYAAENLALMRDDCNYEEINKDLDKKEHYIGMDELVEVPTLDFEKKEDETVGEYLERLEKYTDCFSKYYDGHTVDESVRFDENGDLIEEQKIEKPNFEKVAKSKEAVSELQSGKTVQEIKDEMNPDKTKEEVGEQYGE